MGSPDAEAESECAEKPQHLVRIAYPLAVGLYPVTFDEWAAFAEATNGYQPRDWGWGRGRRPVLTVSWEDVQPYLAWLRRTTGESYRLLSESEWEYACRAGTLTRRWWGDDIDGAKANFDTLIGKTTEVGKYPPNAFGLYDMLGNVREWCEDCWNVNYRGSPIDGSAWLQGACDLRVLRGGSWYDPQQDVRAAKRDKSAISSRYDGDVGFRVCRTVPH